MSTITFDTLKYARQLDTAGFSAVQAEAFVNAQRDVLSEALGSLLATRSDRRALKSDLGGRFGLGAVWFAGRNFSQAGVSVPYRL